MPDHSDIELVRGALRGDARCEEALYRRFSQPMFRVCQRYAANRTEAEDMLQEGFLRVFADLRHFRHEGSLEGWVRRVIVRACLRWLRKRRALQWTELPEQFPELEESPPEEAAFWADESRRAVQLLQNLPPGYRTVLNLYAIEGYRHEEIAEALGISTGASRSQLSKARQLLRKLFEKHQEKHPMTHTVSNDL
ncbi:MAG: sigma-70 family RNA polymerase sigma factor [Saprospiraceae bacterium]|nr:sigma-70 family RNA polymerase sigma factor [Saprospiraceae bacterium]